MFELLATCEQKHTRKKALGWVGKKQGSTRQEMEFGERAFSGNLKSDSGALLTYSREHQTMRLTADLLCEWLQ